MAIDNTKQSNLDSELINAALCGDLPRLVELLAQGADPLAGWSSARHCAASGGHVGCLRLLAPLSDPKATDCSALRVAAANGHAECAKLLIPSPNLRLTIPRPFARPL